VRKLTHNIGNSLTKACHEFIGRKLNKFQQLSNWKSRPLSSDQILYAALDAHCLIAIYAALIQDHHHHHTDIFSKVAKVDIENAEKLKELLEAYKGKNAKLL
jgi:hypothetical protein